MSLQIRVALSRGDFSLAVEFATQARVVALFGPSGSGKTTLLNIVAGLITSAAGRVEVDGVVLQDTAAKTFVPAHRRAVGYVFQEGRLFPHLTVRGNLLYGRRRRRAEQPLASLEEVTDLLGIAHLLGRGTTGLSGGEAQRVALARAILSSPRVLLMDEPLAALDERRKGEAIPYIERLRDRFSLPMLYVSHSRAEVERIATEVVHIEDGRVVEVRGAPRRFQPTRLPGAPVAHTSSPCP